MRSSSSNQSTSSIWKGLTVTLQPISLPHQPRKNSLSSSTFLPMWATRTVCDRVPFIYNQYGNLVQWDSKYYNNRTFICFLLQHTHYPQYAGPGVAGRSLRGPFGDALLEFDNTIGNLLTTLEKTGVINNTLVFFTSDNGLVFAPGLFLNENESTACMYL